MKLQTIGAAALMAGSTLAHPLAARQSSDIDALVLQFALTLEHLENTFYHGALQKFSQQDFINAGYSATYYNNLKYISYDEQSHVKLLTTALSQAGASPVAACTYNFPYTDVRSFITLSSVLEGVGTSAYLGGAPLITSKQYLTVAGSILATEAKHTSYQRAAVGEVPIANPYETPLDPNAVYTLAAAFITSCPASNTPLNFTVFPQLRYSSDCTCEEPDCSPPAGIKKRTPGCVPPSAGGQLYLVASAALPASSYVTFINGLNVMSVQGSIEGAGVLVTIPSFAAGQTYVLITSKDVEGTLTDSAVLFGPVIVEVNPAAPVIDASMKMA